jgi:hypothetical protein
LTVNSLPEARNGSTFTPAYFFSKESASALYDPPANDVYQTTLPSAFAPV